MSGASAARGPGGGAAGGAAWFLLGVLVGGGLFLLGGSVPMRRYSTVPRVDRAARAVVAGRPVRPGLLAMAGRHGPVAVPLGLRFDRERAVQIALELAGARRAGEGPSLEARTAAALARLLAVNPGQAGVILAALEERPRPPALPAEDLRRALALARDAPAWPAAREQLASQLRLDDGQIAAVRRELCRRAVASAFASERGYGEAMDALGKYADLAPAQAEAVLAMAGALELVRAGGEANPALRLLADERPEIGGALLRAVPR